MGLKSVRSYKPFANHSFLHNLFPEVFTQNLPCDRTHPYRGAFPVCIHSLNIEKNGFHLAACPPQKMNPQLLMVDGSSKDSFNCQWLYRLQDDMLGLHKLPSLKIVMTSLGCHE